MYAIFESGGKQHKVVEGETLRLEKLDAAAGEKVDFGKVLLVNDGTSLNVGVPYVEGGKVTAEVVEQGRGDKIKIIKFQRRKHHEKQMGHRQSFTAIKITKIAVAEKKAAVVKEAVEAETSAAKPAKEKAVPTKKKAAVVKEAVKAETGAAKPAKEKAVPTKKKAAVVKEAVKAETGVAKPAKEQAVPTKKKATAVKEAVKAETGAAKPAKEKAVPAKKKAAAKKDKKEKDKE